MDGHAEKNLSASPDEKIIIQEFRTEKDGEPEHIEIVANSVAIPEYTDKEARRIMWKVDLRLIPMLAWFYLLAFLDRGNIGNAKVAGMQKDLHLSGGQYNLAITLFFIPYALLEVPCNIVAKTIPPNVWLAIMMFAWGICMTLMGIVQNFAGLSCARWFLGVCEAGFFPCAAFLLTLFYKRYELLSRLAVFYSCSSLSGAFSGLLAFGLEKMEGVGGLAGWRWIFIIEGFLPILTAVAAFFIVPNSPETCKFLTQEERDFIIYRLQVETGSGRGRVTNNDKLTVSHILAALREWRTWAAVIMFWGCSVGVYAFTFTIPVVILELGFTAAVAQLMTIPIYVVTCGFIIFWAWLSDRYQVRSYFMAGGFILAEIGLIALLVIPHPKLPSLTYFFLFPTAMGLYCNQQLVLAWTANNAAPSSKRAIAMALLISIGNLSGIIGSNIFVQNEAPRYWAGFGTCLTCVVAAQLMSFFLRWSYDKVNKEREKMSVEEVRAKYTEVELLEMGDKSPFFRYTL
ncbi:MFS general substrate transporter [Rhizodiscina lignyota]|uniref:MFS general substrate transporter n=1 Tax=Rhizodiscina lignyota TaxID=1504668 RepID=A0A9P4I3X1_9PEZI|nr:MFS general substrate transporter [Rhizodiscina lignyota]